MIIDILPISGRAVPPPVVVDGQCVIHIFFGITTDGKVGDGCLSWEDEPIIGWEEIKHGSLTMGDVFTREFNERVYHAVVCASWCDETERVKLTRGQSIEALTRAIDSHTPEGEVAIILPLGRFYPCEVRICPSDTTMVAAARSKRRVIAYR